MTVLRLALLTVFGLGRLKPAPGTWGSAAPVMLVLGLLWLEASWGTVNTILVLIAAGFGGACAAFGGWAERHFGTTDPRQVVADEVAGQSVALLFLPWREAGEPDRWAWNLGLAAIAFAAFRFFDIVKPPPVRNVQALPGGWGILLDDLLAAAAALAVGHLAAWLL